MDLCDSSSLELHLCPFVPWDNVKNHLPGVWNNSNVSFDVDSLQREIKDNSLAHVPSSNASEVVNSFLATLQKYASTTARFPSFINFDISILVIISFLFLSQALPSS